MLIRKISISEKETDQHSGEVEREAGWQSSDERNEVDRQDVNGDDRALVIVLAK